ncbi:MAG: DUF1569 domain-containing protein [Planctomycetes bacterium]|nr:DUF1569 domain-containing protein [Planctomycetota bacterium]
MPSLFSRPELDLLITRLERIPADQRPLWGKMNAAQMFAHCRAPLRVATGQQKLKRSLAGWLFGRLAKRYVLRSREFGRNLPTDPSFLFANANDAQKELAALIDELRRFHAGGVAGLTKDPHPFFGQLAPDEWDRLQWKHLDHHLRQFGV